MIFTSRRTTLRCSEKGKVEPMKTMFAQAATFALSAVGALAIFVGAIDQPQVAASVSGNLAGPLVAAAISPAVSALA